jgi:hypothetical protein
VTQRPARALPSVGSGSSRLALLLGLVSLACASAPDDRAVQKPTAVLVAPVSFNQRSMPAPLELGIPVTQEVLVRALWEQDVRVVSPPRDAFRAAWIEAERGVGSLLGPDGKLDPARYDAVVLAVMKGYHDAGERFDAMLIPYLVLRKGSVTGHSVKCDGVSRMLPLEYANRADAHIEARRGLEATCTALRVLAYASDGTRLYERYGGLEVAWRMRVSEGGWRWTERGDLFRNRSDLEDGVELVLSPLLRD